jgi:hypothetical protein
VIGALPRRATESAGRAVGERRVRRQVGFQPFERGADVIAQCFEPRSRARFASFEHALAHKTSDLPLGHGRRTVTSGM